jgi:hypothetical protein
MPNFARTSPPAAATSIPDPAVCSQEEYRQANIATRVMLARSLWRDRAEGTSEAESIIVPQNGEAFHSFYMETSCVRRREMYKAPKSGTSATSINFSVGRKVWQAACNAVGPCHRLHGLGAGLCVIGGQPGRGSREEAQLSVVTRRKIVCRFVSINCRAFSRAVTLSQNHEDRPALERSPSFFSARSIDG